jgi:uncharacterized phage infection (PIP) family protein YhgE
MSYTKATLGDVEVARQQATQTGASATDAGAQAAEGSGQLQAGIERISEALLSHFRQLADVMRQQARTAHDQLGAADWEGRSRQMAVAAATSLQAAVADTLQGAEAGTERFRATMSAEAAGFVEGIRARFDGVMQGIDGAFQDLAGAEAAFASNLQQADETVRFDG